MDTDLSNADASFWGEFSGSYSGSAVSGAGDVNGDGSDDLLIGAYSDDEGGSWAGQTYLILSNCRPPPPTSLKATLAAAAPQITLTWDAADSWNEEIAGYRVYRSTNGFDFDQVAWKLPWDRTYVDTDVVYGRLYHYVVVTEDATGALSEWSATVSLYCDKDTDGDGVGNMADDDDDGDGVLDNRDAFPLNSGESMDTDGDGIGDNADLDDDGDGVPDSKDRFPKNPNEFLDSDGDGIGDRMDPDDDNDGTDDIVEWQNSVNSQFTSLNGALMQVQSNLRNDLDAVEGNLQDTLDALETTLTDQNGNLMDELGNINADLASDIQSLLDNITADLSEVNASLAAELMAARDDILSDANAMEAWLDIVLQALDDELGSANTTLHENIDGLGDDLDDYYTTLSSDLMQVLGQLLAVEGNLSDENTDLADDIALLGLLTQNLSADNLDALSALLAALAESVAAFDEETAASLSTLRDNVADHRSKTKGETGSLATTLENLSKLNDIINDVDELNSNLDPAKSDLDESVQTTHDDEMSSISGNMLVGILILVVVLILILLVIQVQRKTVHLEQPSTHKGETEHVSVIDDDFMMEHIDTGFEEKTQGPPPM
jgi:tetrahydromethanopterin S-methyltransferase subunit B